MYCTPAARSSLVASHTLSELSVPSDHQLMTRRNVHLHIVVSRVVWLQRLSTMPFCIGRPIIRCGMGQMHCPAVYMRLDHSAHSQQLAKPYRVSLTMYRSTAMPCQLPPGMPSHLAKNLSPPRESWRNKCMRSGPQSWAWMASAHAPTSSRQEAPACWPVWWPSSSAKLWTPAFRLQPSLVIPPLRPWLSISQTSRSVLASARHPTQARTR